MALLRGWIIVFPVNGLIEMRPRARATRWPVLGSCAPPLFRRARLRAAQGVLGPVVLAPRPDDAVVPGTSVPSSQTRA